MTIYRVRWPDNHVYSFEGPENATEAEKIAYATHLYNQSKLTPASGLPSEKTISSPMASYSQSTVVSEQLPHINGKAAYLEAGVVVFLAGLVAYILYKFIAPKSKAKNPVELGRRWLAWFAILCVFGAINSHQHEIEERIYHALLFVPVIVLLFGPVVFFIGWLYGKYFRFVISKKSVNVIPPNFLMPDSYLPTDLEIDFDEKIYAQVAHELERGEKDLGLWTKAEVQTNGDDKQTRLLYIKFRAKQHYKEISQLPK